MTTTRKAKRKGEIMNEVQPIRDKKKITVMKTLLKEKDSKYYIMFLLGVNVGLRVSDILELKVADVQGKDHITIKEKKTSKNKRFLVNGKMQKEIAQYIKDAKLSEDDYLIQSRKGDNKPITRIQAYRVLNEVADNIGLEEIGTHTMRKTFGYWHYKQFHDVAILQKLFNHSSPSITLRYIGITSEEMDNTMQDFFL